MRLEAIRKAALIGAGTMGAGMAMCFAQAGYDVALQDISNGFGSSLGVDETIGMIGTRLQKLVPLSACVLYLWDEDAGVFVCRRAVGDEAD